MRSHCQAADIRYYHVLVQWTSMRSTIPTELGNLVKMTSLFVLSYNSLTGPVASELGQLYLMDTVLTLEENSLTGSLPSEVIPHLFLIYLPLPCVSPKRAFTSTGRKRALTSQPHALPLRRAIIRPVAWPNQLVRVLVFVCLEYAHFVGSLRAW